MTSLISIVKSKSIKDAMMLLIELIIFILINTLMIRFLWNTALVKHITILAPLGSIKDALLLVIALNVIKSSCNCTTQSS